MRVSRVSAVLLLSLAALTSAQGEAREGRPKPWLREKMERQKDLFWFRTTEDEAGQAACSAVDEASVEIVPGPPGDTCQEDGARFCFCGKKGAAETTNWKFICGTCHANKPFSFKIERPGNKQKTLGQRAKNVWNKLKQRRNGAEEDGSK